MSFEFAEDCFVRYLYTPGRRLLDAGCGLGSFTLFLCQRIVAEGGTGRITAVDNDLEDLEFAGERIRTAGCSHIVDFLYADLRELSKVPSDLFDNAFMAQTLCWLESAPLASIAPMKEIVRLLKPGGRLSIMETQSNTAFWTCQSMLRHLQGRDHLAWVAVEHLCDLLRLLGLTLIERHLFGDEEKFDNTSALRLLNQIEGLGDTKRRAMQLLIDEATKSQNNAHCGSTYVVHAMKPKLTT